MSVIKADELALTGKTPGNQYYISHSVEPVPTSLSACSASAHAYSPCKYYTWGAGTCHYYSGIGSDIPESGINTYKVTTSCDTHLKINVPNPLQEPS